MKRADALQPLSRDHLTALLSAKRVVEPEALDELGLALAAVHP